MAKQSIRDHEIEDIRKEYYKFCLLKDVDNNENSGSFFRNQIPTVKNHVCQPLGPFKSGLIDDLGLHEKPIFKLEMSKFNDIIGR